MKLNTKPRMDVVKRENKEAKLKTFIANHLSATVASTSCEPWLLIARSVESPVVLALAAMEPELQAAGIKVLALLTQMSPAVADSAAPSDLKIPGEFRIISDVRLLDAHEQLRLDATTSWIGDCMRREPAKRDAYECHAADCTETADWSRKAFDRMWAKGKSVILTAAPAVVEPVTDAASSEFPPPAADAVTTIVALTRH